MAVMIGCLLVEILRFLGYRARAGVGIPGMNVSDTIMWNKEVLTVCGCRKDC